MRKELRQRLAKEYRYAVTKMQEAKPYPKKLFYFSVFFSEAQRLVNREWDSNLALINMVTQQVHTQINTAMQNPAIGEVLPIDWTMVYDRLALIATDLTVYFERTEDEDNQEGLCHILGRLAEIAYAVSGHGSYLHEKGTFKL